MATYVPIPQDDKATDHLKFQSVFTYDGPEYFSYLTPNKEGHKKLQSAFTYTNLDPTFSDVPIGVQKVSVFHKGCAHMLTVLLYVLVFLTFPVTAWFCLKRLKQHERLVIFRLGQMLAVKGPGLVMVLPCIDKARLVDLRTKAFSIPPQQVVMREGCVIEVGADVLYHIKNVVRSISNVQDLNHTTRNLAHTVLQKVIKEYEMKYLEYSKHEVGLRVRDEVNKVTLTWGVEVGEVTLSGIKLISEGVDTTPGEVGKVMNILGQAFLQGKGPYPTGPIVVPESGDPLHLPSVNYGAFETPVPLKPTTHVVGPFGDGPASQGRAEAWSASWGETKPGVSTSDAPERLLAAVQPILSERLVNEFQTLYRFCVVGEREDIYYLDLKNGSGKAGQGEPIHAPDITLTLSVDTLHELITEQTSAVSAYMCGSLQVDGNVSRARKLQDLIDIINSAE